MNPQTASEKSHPPSMNDWLDLALRDGADKKIAREKLQNILCVNDINFIYYLSLYEKYKKKSRAEMVYLTPAPNARLVAEPIASDPESRHMTDFNCFDYELIKKQHSGRRAANCTLIVKRLQAGTGSSIMRQKYLDQRSNMAQILGLPKDSSISIGAKGTDLLAHIIHPSDQKPTEISIAELQILQAWKLALKKQFSQVIIQDLVGPETQSRLEAIWQKPSLIDQYRSYAQIFQDENFLGRLPSIFQSKVPAVDARGQISIQRMAPAGHGLFAFDALLSAKNSKYLKDTHGTDLVVAISNGEDLNSTPDAKIVDWMLSNDIPILLITTVKSAIDKKGGILTLVKDTVSEERYLKVLDTAEAKATGQIEQFENTEGIISTNLTLFNYKILNEKLGKVSESQLQEVMAPDLVPNYKTQKDADGITRTYLQLEGTMGSTIMNLDRYYRKAFGETLVSILNIDIKNRPNFFSPIKSAFDYFMQFHSDLFQLDPLDYKLRLEGTKLPSFSLTDSSTQDQFYSDVQNILDHFKDISLRNLYDLQIVGQFDASHCIFKKNIILINETDHKIILNESLKNSSKDTDSRIVLEDIEIRFAKDGKISTQSLLKKSEASAHARVSLCGSHTDYNMGLTLASLLPAKTSTRLLKRADSLVQIESDEKKDSYWLGEERPASQWSDYIKGVTHILKKYGFQIFGFDAKIESNILCGAGISSSAALVTSVLKALRNEFQLAIDDLAIARMGQEVEHFTGANTGLLDQMTISLLDDDLDSALFINFAEMSYHKVNLPKNAEFAVLDSGLSHQLSQTDGDRNYAKRRSECEEAAKILGLPHLSHLDSESLKKYAPQLPRILLQRVQHIVSENQRVQNFIKSAAQNDLAEMGRIMNKSHLSQKNLYDISEKEIDALVEILQSTSGVYGAQLTGGGFGGAVVFLTQKGQGAKIAEQVLPLYQSHPANSQGLSAALIAP